MMHFALLILLTATSIRCSPNAATNNCPAGTTVTTVSGANVRSQPTSSGGAGTMLGTQPGGATGTIIGTPIPSASYQWYQVDFATGVDGWVGGDNLQTIGSGTPPPTVTGVTANCPASGTVGTAITCTATVQPSSVAQTVTWAPAMPYTPTAAGVMVAKATSTADPTQSGSATVTITSVTPPADCPVINGTFTSTVPVNITIGGVTVPPINTTVTCGYTYDPNTNTMTVTGCH